VSRLATSGLRDERCPDVARHCRTVSCDVLREAQVKVLGPIQILLIFSKIVLVAMAAAYLVLGYNLLWTKKCGRGLLTTSCLISGALVSGFLAWQLVPREWTLPFRATLTATVDSERYGHAAEHYAEGILVMMMTFAALFAGTACAERLQSVARPFPQA
jgi:hypothetical protein